MVGSLPDICIVTALPVEASAVRALVEDLRPDTVNRDRNHYHFGFLPSSVDRRPHRVVVTLLPEDGTHAASAVTADVANSFPSVRCLLMCGIAGGVPHKGVRLGDVVVATSVVDHGHVRVVDGEEELRRHVDGMSRDLLRAENALQTREHGGERPWETWLAEGLRRLPPKFRRPAGAPGAVRVHRGPVASATQLLRDAARRDELARRYGVLAVEMETAGAATSAVVHGTTWFLVRGVSDYADGTKNDTWHAFSALAAAAYLRALLAECKPLTGGDRRDMSAGELSTDRLKPITDALLGVPELRDEAGRRELIALLPARMAASVPYAAQPRYQIHRILRTCAQFNEGRQALLDALRAMLPAGGLGLGHVEAVIDEHWPG